MGIRLEKALVKVLRRDDADGDRDRERRDECWGSSLLRSRSLCLSFFSFLFWYWFTPIAAAAVPAAAPATVENEVNIDHFIIWAKFWFDSLTVPNLASASASRSTRIA